MSRAADPASGRLLDLELLRGFPLPHHPEDGNKNDRGLALLIAGSPELAGAALLAGTAALRSGAGRLRVATAAGVAGHLAMALPEARILAFEEDANGCIAGASIAALAEQCDRADSVTIGPGMQHGPGLADLIGAILARPGSCPLVIDAGALGELPAHAGALRDGSRPLALLPHRGEMARLLDRPREQVDADPMAAAHDAAARFAANVVLKGAPSLIVAPSGDSFHYPGGGIGLATSGSGDILAGIVGGLCGRGADPLTALLWGVWLHGEAGRRLGWQTGRIGFLASELAALIPGLLEGR